MRIETLIRELEIIQIKYGNVKVYINGRDIPDDGFFEKEVDAVRTNDDIYPDAVIY